jgi:tetratricopeptide (TPR) repeat protein
VAVFGATFRFDSVNFDDGNYVFMNRHIAAGLTGEGVQWVFTHSHGGNWHPLTGLSHMLDCQLFGLWPGGHHLTNVLLHAATAISLFLILSQMTGHIWPSALTAALFAIHPLRAESVAWIAERKDVLSGLFFMFTIAAYVAYARAAFSYRRFLLVVVLFALGLMAKPMLVTMPFVLLLLDYWPLGRLPICGEAVAPVRNGAPSGPPPLRWLILEKVPLLALAAASAVLTLQAQAKALEPIAMCSWPSRFNNAVVSYVAYLGQSLYPAGLCALYPHRDDGISVEGIVGALSLLVAISVGVMLARRKRPYAFVGWCWYLGMLVPVIGVVQVGVQARADRYTYLPQVGLWIALAWSLAGLCASRPRLRRTCAVAVALALAALMGAAWRQTASWRNSEELWNRALACTNDNPDAHYFLGLFLNGNGRADEARRHFVEALKIDSDHVGAHNSLGLLLLQQGRLDEACSHFTQALAANPYFVEAHNNLGLTLYRQARFDEAIDVYSETLKLQPEYPEACYNLALALRHKGRHREALFLMLRSLRLNPDFAEAHYSLARLLSEQGNLSEAVIHLREASRLRPTDAIFAGTAAWFLATCPDASLRSGTEAMTLARRASQLSLGKNPLFLDTLAAASAEAGLYTEAAQTARRALALAERQSKGPLAGEIRRHLALFVRRLPVREELRPRSPAVSASVVGGNGDPHK